MKRTLIVALIIFIGAAAAAAQSRSRKKRIGQIAAEIGKTSDLGIFDGKRLLRGSLKVIIEYGIYQVDEEQFEVRRFRSFRAVQKWLRSRQRNGFPLKMSRDFWGCRRGVCRFDNVSQSAHRRIYLQKIFYGYRKNRPFIKTLYFLED